MEELYAAFVGEDYAGKWMEFFDMDDGSPKEFSAAHAAEILETTPQMVGKIITYFEDKWTKTIRKVIYVPKKEKTKDV